METKDIIKGLVESLSQTVNILNVVEPIGQQTEATITVDCVYWIMVLNVYEIGGNEYRVTAINGKEITLQPLISNTPITAESFLLPAPAFFFGTYKMTKQEINANYDKESILPMVWLRAVIEDNITNDSESAIDRSSDIRMYFVATADYENWLTEQHYEQVIYPMKRMVEQFLKLIRSNRFFTDVFDYRTRNLVNLSVGGNQTESLFDINLTGIELRVFSDIRKDLNCVDANNC